MANTIRKLSVKLSQRNGPEEGFSAAKLILFNDYYPY